MARFRGLRSSFFCKRTDPVLMGQPEQTVHISAFGFMHLPNARELVSFGFTFSTPGFYYCSSVTARGAFHILSRQTGAASLVFSPPPESIFTFKVSFSQSKLYCTNLSIYILLSNGNNFNYCTGVCPGLWQVPTAAVT